MSGIGNVTGKFVRSHMHISTDQFPLDFGGVKEPIRPQAIVSNYLLRNSM